MGEINKIIQGDCLKELKNLDDNSVESCVTDPPYGLEFMGKEWDYDVPSVEIWKEVYRVMKPGAWLLSFAGTRTHHRMAVNIEDAGFEIRDMIAWVYGSGFPKSLNIGKAVDKLQGNERVATGEKRHRNVKPYDDENGWNQNDTKGDHEYTKGNSPWEGWGTALKPALEPIVVAQKPREGTFAENILKWGVGGINIDGSRIGYQGEGDLNHTKAKENKSKETKAVKNGTSFQGTGEFMNTQGRFPANFIHDGSEEVERLFPNTGKSRGGKTGGGVGFGKDKQMTSKEDPGFGDSGSASRFFKACNDDPKPVKLKVCIELSNVKIAEKDLRTMSPTEAISKMYSALKNAVQNTTSLSQNLSALFAEKNVNDTEISFVQNLVAILTDGTTEFTGEQKMVSAWVKKLTQEQLLNILIGLNNLAWSAEKNKEELKDTIQTISSLKILYGYVNPATYESTLGRFKYQSKASKSERNKGLEGFDNKHPTVKPISLMRYLVKLVTPPEGTVLDPFMGSGTTGIACKLEGFNFIGIELEEEYVRIAEARIDAWKFRQQQALI